MWPFVKDFLHRGWQDALANGSSTGISVIWLGFCVLTLGFVFTVAIEWLTGGRNMVALAAALRSWKSWVGAILALFVGWVFLFGYSLFSVAYKDHQDLLAAKGKPCPLRTSPLVIPPQKVPKGIQAQTHITQKGNNNTANPGTVTGHVDVKPCGVFQNGGSNNTASPNCVPEVKITASAQTQGQTGNPEMPWITSFTISTSVLVQTGDLKLKCDGPVLKAGISRINPASLITGNNGPNPSDPNEAIYELGPEMLSPGKIVTIGVYSKLPVSVLSGSLGQQKIIFPPQ
jgi:hypothetical protein